MQIKSFIILAIIIWMLEYAMHSVDPSITLLYPTFILLWSLLVRHHSIHIGLIAIVTLLFDVISGLQFGWYTFAILIVIGSIYIVRTYLIERNGIMFLLCISTLFLAQFYAILSIMVPQLWTVINIQHILVQHVAVGAIVYMIHGYHHIQSPYASG